ncbi:MAG TPA: ABC transporter permease [Gemmatimonadaceae bacterium]|nr:ABC transporter permease [Gemmatimonadaceae bacterium]
MVRAKLWAVIRREYLERVQTKAFIIGCLLGPVFIAGVLFVPAWLSLRNLRADPANLIVIDATGAGLGERLRSTLDSVGTSPNAQNTIDVRVTPPDGIAAAESLATKAVVAKEVEGYLVLDASTLRGERARYAGRKATALGDMRRLETALRQTSLAQRLEHASLSPALVDSLTRSRLVLASERLTEQGRGSDKSRQANLVFAVAVAFLLYMSMILYGQTVLRGVLEEKSTRVAEVVVSSVSPETLLAGKVIGVGAVGLTQQIIWVIGTVYVGSFLAPILARMAPSSGAITPEAPGAAAAVTMSMPDIHITSLLLILVFFILGYGVYSSLYAAVGATVNSEQEAQQALAPILVLIISSSLLIQPAMMNPTSTLARVASMFPFSAPIIMPLRMSLVPIPPWEMAVSVLGLAVAFFAVILLAARIYRVGLLMYGKRPSLGELAKWVRQS